MSPCLTSQLPSIYAVTAQFVKYLQVPACPCCFFLSFADRDLPRSLCLEIALPNLDIHPCTKRRELVFPGSECWAGRQSWAVLVLH